MSAPLLFLRPRALPATSTIQRFLRFSYSTTPSPPETKPYHANSSHAPKPYRVLLSSSDNLPVYTLKKAGGNRLLTKIKNVEGDIEALKKDISVALGMEGHKEVVINELTRSVILKGHKPIEVKKFLLDSGVGYKEKVELL
ncbi:mitochondrial large subunit ribosomal protein-domain-containing protein [Tricladium varicosporioides]|nr:mitochondrial large subunit ribosomal protein-domain-containing protein [Hymenoscyphus varicosporioides]